MILGFKEQFRSLILGGTKIHTIREDKKDRWKAGNVIHFATGVRTKKYNLFSKGECKSTQGIILVNHGNHVYCNIQTAENEFVHNDCVEHEHIKFYKGSFARKAGEPWLLEDLCKNDGLTWAEFRNWFVPNNGDKFVGKIIHWTDFRYDRIPETKGNLTFKE